MVITRSNKRANIFNQGIRNTILGCEDELTTGDLVMVVKNKYLEKDRSTDLSFIANGDHAVVRRVRNIRELYGFRFADVSLEFPDYNKNRIRHGGRARHARCRSTSTNTGAEHKLFQS